MALADLLVTRPGLFSGFKKSDSALRRELFDGLVRRGALVLGFPLPFTVTRWTNLWFPVIRGSLHGDWFGGPVGPLFGPGIRDIAVQGNKPERFKRGSAHNEYFRTSRKRTTKATCRGTSARRWRYRPETSLDIKPQPTYQRFQEISVGRGPGIGGRSVAADPGARSHRSTFEHG